MEVRVRAPAANTSAATLAIDGLAAKTIVKFNNTNIAANEIAGVSHELLLRYSATLDKWLLLNPNPFGVPVPIASGGTNSTSAAAARAALGAEAAGALRIVEGPYDAQITSGTVTAGPATQSLLELACGGPHVGGDFILINWELALTKGGASGLTFSQMSAGGSGSTENMKLFNNVESAEDHYYHQTAVREWRSHTHIFQVSTPGTLVLKLAGFSDGSSGTISQASIRAYVVGVR
jgi:hypothetical protein